MSHVSMYILTTEFTCENAEIISRRVEVNHNASDITVLIVLYYNVHIVLYCIVL